MRRYGMSRGDMRKCGRAGERKEKVGAQDERRRKQRQKRQRGASKAGH